MPTDLASRRDRFFDLHEKGCFLLPNPWDAGGAKRLEALGFQAIASTSAGAAWAMGHGDGELTRGQVLGHLTALCAATSLPVNADFEAGFADEPGGVAESVTLAVETGVAGLSIEDRTGKALYPLPLAAERIAAARRAIDATGQRVLLVARCEGHLLGPWELDETIARLRAYSAAGADCLYAPGLMDLAAIRHVVDAVSPKPVNVLLLGDMRVADLAAAGVRRVSTGGGLARASWTAFEEAAKQLLDDGTLAPGARR
jgi:2-methylisocitrate lyase-like PEP mutase family enzyme